MIKQLIENTNFSSAYQIENSAYFKDITTTDLDYWNVHEQIFSTIDKDSAILDVGVWFGIVPWALNKLGYKDVSCTECRAHSMSKTSLPALYNYFNISPFELHIKPKVNFKLQKKYSSELTLQFVALAPLEFWDTTNGEDLAKIFSSNGGILGGVIVPPFNKKDTSKFLAKTLLLASKYKLEIDLHIDESIIEPGAGIKVLLETIENLKINNIPITCSHLSSLISLSHREILYLGEKMAEKNIKVIALPLTNFWLLNRSNKTTSLKRPVAPIKQLQKSHVDVSLGSDNIQDPWYPFGNFDPFYMLSCSIPMLQLNPWERMTLSSIFLAPSRLLNLKWDGLIKKGCPADFVILDAQRWADVFSTTLKRKVYIKGDLYC